MATNWESGGLLPEAVAREVLSAAQEQSAAMDLATVRRMAEHVEWLPLVELAPSAGWVEERGGKKPYSEVTWSSEKLVPRELAAITAVADSILRDAGFDVEASVQSEFSAAISRVLDAAIFHGEDRRAGYPELLEGAPVNGEDPLDAIDRGLSVIEASGILATAIVASPAIGGALRRAYQAVAALSSEQPTASVWGVPVRIAPSWPANAEFDTIIGNWSFLVLGVREDISFERTDSGVLTDDSGNVTLSAFESDTTLIRCHCRIGAGVGRPAGPNGPITPFVAVSCPAVEPLGARAKK
jgi:Phage capsid family